MGAWMGVVKRVGVGVRVGKWGGGQGGWVKIK